MKKKWLMIVGMAVMLSLSGCAGAKDTEKAAEIHTEQKNENETEEETKAPKKKNEEKETETETEKESLTGWVEESDVWYYYTEDGERLVEDWLEDKNVWYYFDSEGKMIQNSWKEVDGKLYYFGEDGGMYVNTTTPDGSKVDENGAKVIVMTVAQRETIERFLEEEIRRLYYSHDHILASELTKEDVRSFGHTLLFYDPVLGESILPLRGSEMIWDAEAYYDLEEASEFLENLFGIDPELKNGESYFGGDCVIDDPANDFDTTLDVRNNRVSSLYNHGNEGDPWGVLENVRYKAQGDRIRIEGLFTEDSNGGLIYMDMPFVAEFKINPKNHFPFQLVSVEWDNKAGIDLYADLNQVQEIEQPEANHRVIPEAEILWHFLDNPSDFQEEAGDYTGIVMPEDAMFAMADVTGDYVDDLVVKTVLYGMAYDDLVWDQYLVFDGTMADTVADQTYLGDVQFFEGGYVTEWMPEYCDKHYLLYLIDNVNVGLYYAGNPVDSFLAGDWDNIEEVRADMEARAEVYNVDLTGWDPAEGVEMSLEEAQLRVKQFVSGKRKLSLKWTPINVKAVEDYFDVVY